MSTFITLLINEIKRIYLHASTYFVIAFFLLLMGFCYILFLYSRSTMEICTLQSFFNLFWIPTLCIIPLLCMRTFSEERRLGLLESLLSTAIGTHRLVFSKFLATYGLYLTLWGLSFFFPVFSQYWLRQDLVAPLFTRQVFLGGCIFLMTSSFLFISLGLFASSLTRSQSVAGLLCFSFLFICFVGFRFLGEVVDPQMWNVYFEFPQVLDNLCAGIFDVRPCLFYLLSGTLVLELTALVVEAKSLR